MKQLPFQQDLLDLITTGKVNQERTLPDSVLILVSKDPERLTVAIQANNKISVYEAQKGEWKQKIH